MRFSPYVLLLESTAVPFAAADLSLGNDLTREQVQLAGDQKISYDAVLKKRPFIRCVTRDPRVVTDWTKVNITDGTYDHATAIFRELEENGSWGSTYKSFRFTNGILVPRSLSSKLAGSPELAFDLHGLYASGAAYTVGTTSASLATGNFQYMPKDIVIGGNTISAPDFRELSLEWAIPPLDDDQYEPSYLSYLLSGQSGSVILRDFDEVTAARLDDGGSETTFTITLEDKSPTGNADHTITLGTCSFDVEVQNRDVKINFRQVVTT